MQIDVHNLSYSFGHKILFDRLSFSLGNGDFLIVRGKNGAGKSMLMKCLLGLVPVKGGMIFYDHQDLVNFKDWPSIGYVSQQFEAFNYEFPISVDEFLRISSLAKTNQAKRLKLLDQMGIMNLLNENINNLSERQLQRVFIVRAMLNDPKVMILDEPVSTIDKDSSELFIRNLNTLNKEGVTVVLITHKELFPFFNYTHVLTLHGDGSFKFSTRANTDLKEGDE